MERNQNECMTETSTDLTMSDDWKTYRQIERYYKNLPIYGRSRI